MESKRLIQISMRKQNQFIVELQQFNYKKQATCKRTSSLAKIQYEQWVKIKPK